MRNNEWRILLNIIICYLEYEQSIGIYISTAK